MLNFGKMYAPDCYVLVYSQILFTCNCTFPTMLNYSFSARVVDLCALVGVDCFIRYNDHQTNGHYFTVRKVTKRRQSPLLPSQRICFLLYHSSLTQMHKNIEPIQAHCGTRQHCSTSVQPGTNCSAPIV